MSHPGITLVLDAMIDDKPMPRRVAPTEKSTVHPPVGGLPRDRNCPGGCRVSFGWWVVAPQVVKFRVPLRATLVGTGTLRPLYFLHFGQVAALARLTEVSCIISAKWPSFY